MATNCWLFVRKTPCLAVCSLVFFFLIGTPPAILLHSRLTRTIHDVDWGATALAASAPWAQIKDGGQPEPRQFLRDQNLEVFSHKSNATVAAPRLRWPVRVVSAKCGPGGAITLASGKDRGSQGTRAAFNMQHGIQLDLDGPDCVDGHLDAGSCLVVDDEKKKQSVRCLPILVIPGVQKAGTGAIRNFLLRHENLDSGRGFSAAGKEINFFNNPDRSTTDYLEIFPEVARLQGRQAKATAAKASAKATTAKATEFFFDKSPAYLSSDAVRQSFSRMAKLAPSMAVVVVLRNPTDRAYSAFKHDARHSRWFRYRAEAAAVAQHPACKGQGPVRMGLSGSPPGGQVVKEGVAPEDFHCALVSMGGNYGGLEGQMLEQGLYARQLSVVLEHFPRGQVLVLWFEAAMQHLLATVRDIEAFLGLPHSDFVGRTELTPIGHVRLKASAASQLEEAAAPALASLGLGGLLSAKACASTGVACRGHSSAPMPLESRALLDAFFANPNTELLKLLHPVPHPGPHPAAAAGSQKRPPPIPPPIPGHLRSGGAEEGPAAGPATAPGRASKKPAPPPIKWAFHCECAAAGGTRRLEVCRGKDALERIASDLAHAEPPGCSES
mmetsp:Transcript_24124/g.54444  ORF Transcript_24124/g.54444 Transcript_24124/m.54444 type:complete len:610 (+) Transcript_24124:301-2130(+)